LRRPRSATPSRWWRSSSSTAIGSDPARIITLTTDFGLRDPWVGIMKGVILGIAPDVRLVDITHEIAPHDVLEAALALEAAVPFFPAGTVHLAVVDPGVGSSRRAIIVARAGQWFVGPDNGTFTPFLDDAGRWGAVELSATWCRAADVSPTFHGRDVFAPAAAHLARGAALERFGPELRDPLRLRWPAALRRSGALHGEVVHLDRFGNLITSIRATDLSGDDVVEVSGRELPIVGTYSDLPPGATGALIGSGGRLEIAAREESAARSLGIGRGARVTTRRHRNG
jgi:S-adenosylmethionine hydrolase